MVSYHVQVVHQLRRRAPSRGSVHRPRALQAAVAVVIRRSPNKFAGLTRVLPGEREDTSTVARFQISRDLRSGKLDVLDLDEATLARIVADGAAILYAEAKARPDGC